MKYRLMFSTCDVLVVNKIDYLQTPLTDFDLDALRKRVTKLNSGMQIFAVSSKTGDGIDLWAKWLLAKVRHL